MAGNVGISYPVYPDTRSNKRCYRRLVRLRFVIRVQGIALHTLILVVGIRIIGFAVKVIGSQSSNDKTCTDHVAFCSVTVKELAPSGKNSRTYRRIDRGMGAEIIISRFRHEIQRDQQQATAQNSSYFHKPLVPMRPNYFNWSTEYHQGIRYRHYS
jgi:hypothetical protein